MGSVTTHCDHMAPTLTHPPCHTLRVCVGWGRVEEGINNSQKVTGTIHSLSLVLALFRSPSAVAALPLHGRPDSHRDKANPSSPVHNPSRLPPQTRCDVWLGGG